MQKENQPSENLLKNRLLQLASDFLIGITNLEFNEIQKVIRIPTDNFFIDLENEARIFINRKESGKKKDTSKKIERKGKKKKEKRKVIVL